MLCFLRCEDMLIPIERLKQYDFAHSNIRAVRQMPKHRYLKAAGRICNGFIYVVSGKCQYNFRGDHY